MDKAILFLETSEEKPTPAKIDSNLSDYENMGILSSLSGLLVGRPTRYSEEEREHLRAVILERTANYDFPIITDVDFGHTSPMFTIPIGCEATIDSSKNEFCIIEPAVQE
jgi:muramoyltetrapeptide carboxypeptidase LdcA involved in peptidoglycan recycling